MNVTLAPEKLFELGPIAITNSVFTGLIVAGLICLFVGLFNYYYSYARPGKVQLIVESLVDGLYGMVKDILGDKTKPLFGFLFTFFIFIFVSNIFGLLPITPSFAIDEPKQATVEEVTTAETEITEEHSVKTEEPKENEDFFACLASKHCYLTLTGVREFEDAVHIFRAPSSDISMTLAFALISVVVTNILGFVYNGLPYLKKYINFSNPINGFVGILEMVSELGKLISFSFRLFGNIFAGEILLAVITTITFGLATLPFLALELFIGFIQAFVFFILTTVFIGLATGHQEH